MSNTQTESLTGLLSELRALLGDKGLLEGEALVAHPAAMLQLPKALMRPATTAELAETLKLCHRAGQPVVAQGGRTGIVAGQSASADEMVVSLERMNAIEQLDESGATITVQAGVPLQRVQEAAEEKGFMFPLDLGARGSATIGGNIATNAGGNRVLRYGMMRELVLGLEAVLADGTVITTMNQVIKNNTGYDLKQLFIGSEGTLGIVTRAVLRLKPLPCSHNTALLAVNNFEQVISVLRYADAGLGGHLSSFEVMWQGFYQHILKHSQRHSQPLADEYPYYIIVESMGGDQQQDEAQFEKVLTELFETGLVADAVLAKSVSEREALWAIRDDIEAIAGLWPLLAFDVSVPLGEMETYITDVETQLKDRWPEASCIIFGHLGDSNIHLIVSGCGELEQVREAIEQIVYSNLKQHQGVISAEHGIGLEKKAYLDMNRSPAEVALMKTIKQALDPQGLLNPGKIFDLP